MSQPSQSNEPKRRPSAHFERVLERIAELSLAALRFVPPTRIAERMQRWIPDTPGALDEVDLERRFAAALALVRDFVLFAPSASGATAIDRMARQRKPADASEAVAIDALRAARFRVTCVQARESGEVVRLHDRIAGETLHVIDAEIPADAAGLFLAVRTGPLGDGRHALIGAITPLDDAAYAVALGFARPDGKGFSHPQRCTEAVYRHVIRNGGMVVPGLNATPESSLDPEACDLADIARDWASLRLDADRPAWTIQRVRDLTSLGSVLDVLAASVFARQDRRERLAGAYARIAAIQLETIRLREANGVLSLTLAAVCAAIAQKLVTRDLPAGVRGLFEELRGRNSADAPGDTRDLDLERLIARIQALRAKTVGQGCTEPEALAAAEKVAELLDRYGLSLDAIELRRQACQGVGIETGRRRLVPVDDCVPSVAAFFDCRAWSERSGSAPIRHIIFGLRADVAAAHYLYDLIGLAFTTETETFTGASFCAGLSGGQRRSATHSFHIGLARGIIAKLHRLRQAREVMLCSSGRDLVPVKSAVVEDELARLGLHFRPGSRASRRRVIIDAFAAGEEAGSRFKFHPGLTVSP